MSEALVKRGHDVTLFMVKKFGERYYTPYYVKPISTIQYPLLSGFFYGLIIFFYFPIIFRKKKIDIILIDCTKIWLPFVISLKILNIPIVLDIRTLPIDRDKSLFFKISLIISRYIVDGISTITPELGEFLRDKYNIKTDKIGIWSSGVTVEDFKKTDNTKTQNKSNNRKFTLIYHGDYSPTRGIEYLIRAIGKLDLSIKSDIRLLIIGMPEDKLLNLSKLCINIGLQEQIEILPKVEYDKISHYINISDVGIIPLPPENNWWRVSAPLKTLEYLAAGKPIIATNIPFHKKIFNISNCGILVESADPEVLAEGITSAYKKRKHLKKIGMEGRKIVEKFYTWDYLSTNFGNFLLSISKVNKK
jgi:glycosyltransferase involved in cell wall biosynthesis